MFEYVSVGVACTIIGVAISYAIYIRDKEKDNITEGRQDGVILTEIGYIKSGIDDIKSEQREQRKINTEVYSKLSAVEADAKQAHLRLDRLEEREFPLHSSHK